MARNLQAKLPPSDTLRLFDVNRSAPEKLAQEIQTAQAGGAAVELAESASEASRNAVCSFPCRLASPPSETLSYYSYRSRDEFFSTL